MALPELPDLPVTEALELCGFTEQKELAALLKVNASTVTRWENVPAVYVPIVFTYSYWRRGGETQQAKGGGTPDRGVRYRGASLDIGHDTWLEMPADEKRAFFDQLGSSRADPSILEPAGSGAATRAGPKVESNG